MPPRPIIRLCMINPLFTLTVGQFVQTKALKGSILTLLAHPGTHNRPAAIQELALLCGININAIETEQCTQEK